MKHTRTLLTALLLASLAGLAAVAAEKKPMPKEDVVDVPAHLTTKHGEFWPRMDTNGHESGRG